MLDGTTFFHQTQILMRFHILLITLLIGCASCETETYVDYFIDNQSSTTITVEGSNIISSIGISEAIASGERKIIASWSKLGKSKEIFEPESMFGTDLIITNSEGDTLLKDFKELDSWVVKVNEERWTATHDYTLEIMDTDF